MRRIRIVVAYDGTDFHGWQVQPDLSTIQGTLEAAISEIEGKPVQVAGSGRTDAGVHAMAQVAAFTLENRIPLYNLRKAANALLPPSIRVTATDEAAPDFHPRYNAKAKTYEYRIAREPACPPWEYRYVHHYPYPLDIANMIRLAPVFEGEHDFTAFAASDESDAEGRSKVRTVFSSQLLESGSRLIYRVRGSGFLKHMVRNMVGTMIEGGKGHLDEAGLRALLAPAERKAGPTAPAKGLFLIGVEY